MNGKKVGILTFFNRMNYGAELQAYALHKKVRDLGYDCELLDVLSPRDASAKKPQVHKPLASSIRIESTKSRINHKISYYLAAVLGSKNDQNRKRRFEAFKRDYLTVSKQKFASVDDLYCYEMPYDIFITGSDQVWNPQTTLTSPEPYFLTFAAEDKLKISYAASFGVSSFPDEMKSYYKKWLANIDYISVRENQGADIVRDISGRTATVVLDPTLLLNAEDWNKAAAEPLLKKPYILLYTRIHSPYITRLACYLSRKTGYSIVRIPRGNIREGVEYKVKNMFDTGPSEFLGLFKNASFVLTSSFHGTAFAVNFNKPFYSIVRKGGAINSRMISLLGNLNLESRLLFDGDDFPKDDDIFVDFSKANVALAKEREKSLSFLAVAFRN